MKVVIDIPEDDYKLACNYPDCLIACYAHYIKNGIALPKGHGDLIDRKELIKYPPVWMQDSRRTGDDTPVILLNDILKAMPVIQADKEDTE